MKKVIVASKNPAKISAVRQGFERMFPGEKFEYLGVSVSSEVSEQPTSNEESLSGATNRAQNAMQEFQDATFWVGLEGGIEIRDREVSASTWVVVLSRDGRIGKGKGGELFLPKKIAELVIKGYALHDAVNIVLRENNAKENGVIGTLTGDALDRASSNAIAVIMALIPFKNPELY